MQILQIQFAFAGWLSLVTDEVRVFCDFEFSKQQTVERSYGALESVVLMDFNCSVKISWKDLDVQLIAESAHAI